MIPFFNCQDPLKAEEVIEILQKHHISFERTFEKTEDLEDYIGSNPFDTTIVIKISNSDFSKAKELLKDISN